MWLLSRGQVTQGKLWHVCFLGGSSAEVRAHQTTGSQEPLPLCKKPWALRGCFPEMAGEAPDCRRWSRPSVMPGIFTGEAWRRNGSSWPGNCQEEAHPPPPPPKLLTMHTSLFPKCAQRCDLNQGRIHLYHTPFPDVQNQTAGNMKIKGITRN